MNESGLKVLALAFAGRAGALEAVRGSERLFSANAGARASKPASANAPASSKLADSYKGPSNSGFAPAVKVVLPTVVNILSSKVVRAPGPSRWTAPSAMARNSNGKGLSSKSATLPATPNTRWRCSPKLTARAWPLPECLFPIRT